MRYPITPVIAIIALSAVSLRAAEPALDVPATGTGLDFVNPIVQASKKTTDRCRNLTAAQRVRTHLFVVNGLDPFYLANLNGFCHHVRGLGFQNVWFSELIDSEDIEKKIVAVREKDPSAKVILLGYSFGANEARSICNSLNEKSLCVDLLVYIGGDHIMDEPKSRPKNAGKILNITGHGCFLLAGNLFINGDDIAGARNLRLKERHFSLPSRSETMEAFLSELYEVARAAERKPAAVLGEPVPIRDPR